MAKKENFDVIYETWTPLAMEYMIFLRRNKIEPIGIITGRNKFGYTMSVYANSDKYLKLSKKKNFNDEEKQFIKLLTSIKQLYILIFEIRKKKNDDLELLDDEESSY